MINNWNDILLNLTDSIVDENEEIVQRKSKLSSEEENEDIQSQAKTLFKEKNIHELSSIKSNESAGLIPSDPQLSTFAKNPGPTPSVFHQLTEEQMYQRLEEIAGSLRLHINVDKIEVFDHSK